MYHIAVNGVKQGPVSEAEVREKIARGELQPTDLCWREGWLDWRRIEVAFPVGGDAVPPPLAAPAGAAANPFTGTPKQCGLAIASLVCGIGSLVFFPFFFLLMWPAIICGHLARSRVKKAKGALAGAGLALAGLILGYTSIVPGMGMMAAMAIPAFHKVREQSLSKMMDNDARQIAAAAQQHFLETETTCVEFSYNAATGEVSGPLATYVGRIGRGYTVVPTTLTKEGGYELAHPKAGPPRGYDADGRRQY